MGEIIFIACMLVYIVLRIFVEKAECVSKGFALYTGTIYGVALMVIGMIVDGYV